MIYTLLHQQVVQIIFSVKSPYVCIVYFTWCKRGGMHPLDAQPVPLWASNLVSVCFALLLLLWIVIVHISLCIRKMHSKGHYENLIWSHLHCSGWSTSLLWENFSAKNHLSQLSQKLKCIEILQYIFCISFVRGNLFLHKTISPNSMTYWKPKLY